MNEVPYKYIYMDYWNLFNINRFLISNSTELVLEMKLTQNLLVPTCSRYLIEPRIEVFLIYKMNTNIFYNFIFNYVLHVIIIKT